MHHSALREPTRSLRKPQRFRRALCAGVAHLSGREIAYGLKARGIPDSVIDCRYGKHAGALHEILQAVCSLAIEAVNL